MTLSSPVLQAGLSDVGRSPPADKQHPRLSRLPHTLSASSQPHRHQPGRLLPLPHCPRPVAQCARLSQHSRHALSPASPHHSHARPLRPHLVHAVGAAVVAAHSFAGAQPAGQSAVTDAVAVRDVAGRLVQRVHVNSAIVAAVSAVARRVAQPTSCTSQPTRCRRPALSQLRLSHNRLFTLTARGTTAIAAHSRPYT